MFISSLVVFYFCSSKFFFIQRDLIVSTIVLNAYFKIASPNERKEEEGEKKNKIGSEVELLRFTNNLASFQESFTVL